MAGRSRTEAAADSLIKVGGRFGRHTAVYGAGALVTLVAGLVSVAVLTRYMRPAEYGVLAVLLVFSALLTVVYTLGVLQGAFLWVYGSSGDEDAGDDDTDDDVATNRRKALGTALAAIALTAAAGTAVIAYFAADVAGIVTGDRGDADLVRLAAAAGALGALWRLVHNVLRMERRPGGFFVLNAVRPILVLGISVPLVAAGHGVTGALTGVAAGTGGAILAALAMSHRSYALALNRYELRNIGRAALPFVPVTVALWILHNADVYLLSRVISDGNVGIYRVAGRAGALMSYFVSAYLMAWGPLQRTPMFAAVKQERGICAVSGKFATYFALASFGLLLALAITADVVVHIAAPSYHDAASLIPLIGLGLTCYGAFNTVYRLARFPHKRLYYSGIALAAAGILIGSAAVLIPWLGAPGAPVAMIVSAGVGAVAILFLSQRGPEPIEFEYGRIAAGAALALACLGAARAGGELAAPWNSVTEGAALVAYPALLVLLRIIPAPHVAPLRRVLRSVLPQRRRPERVRIHLAEIDVDDRRLLETLVRERRDAADVGADLWLDEEEVLARGVRALRAVGGHDHAATAETDAEIGQHLLSRRPVAERDAVARQLWNEGVPATEVDGLESTLHALRRLPRRAWIVEPEIGEVPLESDVALDVAPSPAPRAEEHREAPEPPGPRPLKVCMLLHKRVDHDARVLREARTLRAAGHDVAIVHLGPAGGKSGDANLHSASPHEKVRETLPFGLYRLAYLRNFVRRIRELNPDVVHAHDTAMLVPGLIGSRLTGARLVYDSHEYAVGVAYHERAWALLVAAIERMIIRRCAAVITVSQGIADQLQQRYRLRRSPAVVRNLPDLEPVVTASPESGGLRDSLGVDGVPLLLHQGAVADGRGCETLIRAVAALGGSAGDAHLVFLGAGDDAYARGLRALADDSGLGDRIHFVPPVPLEGLLAYTAEADVGVSLLEPTCTNHALALPNKVFEYVAAGLPVVVSALPEVASIVRRYEIGWTVDPTNSEAVAEGLEAALGARSDRDLHARVEAAARVLNWRREQGALVAVYEQFARPSG